MATDILYSVYIYIYVKGPPPSMPGLFKQRPGTARVQQVSSLSNGAKSERSEESSASAARIFACEI